jgi:hypothetical protein
LSRRLFNNINNYQQSLLSVYRVIPHKAGATILVASKHSGSIKMIETSLGTSRNYWIPAYTEMTDVKAIVGSGLRSNHPFLAFC